VLQFAMLHPEVAAATAHRTGGSQFGQKVGCPVVEEANTPSHLRNRASSERERRAKKPHLTGVRTLVAMWIVCHHMATQRPASSISVFTMRVDVAVELFMMLSGFMTHYAYGDVDNMSSAGSLLCFYVRRLARVCITAQLAMLCCVFWLWYGNEPAFTAKTASCMLFLRPWYEPEPDCPDAPMWFVAALIPSWLLYPLITRRVLSFDGLSSPRALVMVCGALWLAALGPALVIIGSQGHWLTWSQVKFTWFWPPAQLADFALGSAVAALVVKAPPRPSLAKLGDVALATTMLACLLVPISQKPVSWTGPLFRPGHYIGWDALSARLASPLLAVWIYCSSGDDGSVTAKFLSHGLFVSAGAYTLEVYLLQTPLHALFIWTERELWLPAASTEVFVMYLWLLWILCVIFVDKVAAPADKWLRNTTATWVDQPLSYFFRPRRNDRDYDGLVEFSNGAHGL